MKEELQLLLNEAKTGILTVSDFYKEELVTYFTIDIVMGLIFAILMSVVCSIVLYKGIKLCKKGQYDSEFAGGLMAIFAGIGLLFSVLGLFCTVQSLIMINVAPKIYITKEVLNLF